MLGWRNKKTSAQKPIGAAAPGFRDSSSAAFKPGEVVDNAYQVRQLVGTSPSGHVFAAWDMVLERLVALKAAWRDPDTPPLLVEARALSKVASDCVVQIYGLGHHRGVEYMVMEGVVGMTLADRIAEAWDGHRRMPVEEGLSILQRLAEGLAAVHQAGLTHGDLRSDSVLYPGGGRVVFTGLGLSPGARDARRPPSLAPEIVRRGRAGTAPGSLRPPAQMIDLYALGCIGVELLTGKPPYSGPSLEEVVESHLHQAVPDVCALRRDLPTELGDLIAQLLAKEPDHRPVSAAEVASQLAVISARAQARPRRETVKILLVDDDADEVRALWSRMRRAHERIDVEAARNATDAIADVRRAPPQVLVFAMDLPGSMNGYELAMYLEGAGDVRRTELVALIDEASDAAAALEQIGVSRVVVRGPALGDQIAALVRELADHALHGAVPVAG